MNIMNKLKQKALNNMEHEGVTIAFLGDSVTQGCFEIFMRSETEIDTVFDKESAYHKYLSQILSVLYPTVPVNIINAGISGDSAPHGLQRLQKDVLRHEPDLVVVCFGLNDVCQGIEKLEQYTNALRGIFREIQKTQAEVIFMTPNMINTQVSVHITNPIIRNATKDYAKIQNEGVMDAYMDGAIAVCEECGVTVCDCYHKWKQLADNGVNTTELLANHINHPTRQMNWLFAVSLMETMLQ